MLFTGRLPVECPDGLILPIPAFAGTFRGCVELTHSYLRTVSKRERGELFIHRPDGKIRDRDSHGNDPRRSKG